MLAAKSVWEPAALCGWEESLVLTPLPASSWKVTTDLVAGRSQLFPFSSSRDLKSIPSEVGPWEEEGQFFSVSVAKAKRHWEVALPASDI